MLGHRVRLLLKFAGTESHYQATAVQFCPGISYPERDTLHHRDITATGGVQQPPLGQELAPCRRALMIRRGEACMVTARSMENVYLSLLCLFRMFFFIKNLLITNDWSQNSPFSTLLDGAHPSHHTASFRGILVILVK